MVALVCFVGAIPAGADPGESQEAIACGRCHTNIHAGWSKSLHAAASTNSIYATAYRKAYVATEGGAAPFCQSCHAPLAEHDGVTCDACHTVEKVDLTDTMRPYTRDAAGEKRASLKNAVSPVHKAAYVEWFNTSQMCAGCHRLVNVDGAVLSSTYDEWKESVYAENNVHCQNCHMTETAGAPVDPEKASTKRTVHNDHSLGHSAAGMKGAVKVASVGSAVSTSGRLAVDLEVTNVKVGHNVPTGSPLRKLLIRVTVNSGAGSMSQEVRLGKTVANAAGRPLNDAADIYLEGKGLQENTALKPAETRKLRVMFPTAPKGEYTVTTEAFLTYDPEVTTRENMRIPMSVHTR
jgi:hypothetical protein